MNVKLLKRFLKPIHYLPTESGIVRKGPKFTLGKRLWVVPRARCLFKVVETGDVSFGLRNQAVELIIISWTPFEKTAQYTVAAGSKTLVWIWDGEKQSREAKLQKVENVTVVPETVMRGECHQDEIILVDCLEGVEGRIWRDEILIASRWWPELPDEKQWFRFCLKHELSSAMVVASPRQADIMPVPWAKMDKGYRAYFTKNEYAIVGLLVGCAVMYCVWQGVTGLKLQAANSDLQVVVEQKNKKVAPVLIFRDQANSDLETLKTTHSLTPFPSQLEIILAVVNVLKGDSEIVKWNYISGSVTLKIHGENLDPQVIIEKLDATLLFNEISAERGSRTGQIEVKMQVNKV